MKENKFLRFLTSKWLISFILLLAISVFLGSVFVLNSVPEKYLLIIGGVLLSLLIILFIVEAFGDRRKNQGKSNKRGIVAKVLSLILSISLVFATSYMVRTNNFIDKIAQVRQQEYLVSVIVLKNSNIKKISDLSDKKVGTSYQHEKDNLLKTVAKVEEQAKGLKEEKFDDYVKLADALYDKKVEAIIVGDEYRSMMETNHENFEGETRVVKSYKFKKTDGKTTTVDTDVTTKPFNVYITGIDTYGSINTVSRSDVNLILSVNPKLKQILLVSIPRDTKINLHRNGKMDKLTHTGIYGTDETIKTIEDFLGTQINYFARTNFTGITNIIDALGGVKVDSPFEFTTRHGNYKIVKGENQMDGDKALCFVRERYALKLGDYERGANQQRLIKAILQKAMSATVLTNYQQILDAVEGSFETDLSSNKIKSLVKMQLNDQAKWTIHSVQLQGIYDRITGTYSMPSSSISVMTPNEKQLKQIKYVLKKNTTDKTITSDEIKSISTKVESEQ